MPTVQLELEATDGKDAVVWFAPVHNGPTEATALSPTATVDVQVDGTRGVAFTVMTPDKGRFELVGTTVIVFTAGAQDGESEVKAELVAHPDLGLRDTQLLVAVRNQAARIVTVNPKGKLSSKCYPLQEKTWHQPTCIAGGVESLRPVQLSAEGVDRLITRWSNYYRMAKMITDPANTELMLELVVGFTGGNYHKERGDGRAIAGLSFCMSDDCDGMAWDAVSFITQLMHCRDRVLKRPRFDGRALFVWAAERYPSAVVTYGQCLSPTNGTPFMHAWFTLLAVPRAALQPWSKLTDDQQDKLKAAGIDADQWAKGEAVKRAKWATLTVLQRIALEALGYTATMWDATPKLHGEATGVISPFEPGAVKNEAVNVIVKELRGLALLHTTRLLWPPCVRWCPEQYRTVEEVHGPYYAHCYKRPLRYATFLESPVVGPRPEITCCSGVTQWREPVFIERSRANAAVAGLENMGDRLTGPMPHRDAVKAITNPDGPFGENTTGLVRVVVPFDYFNAWLLHLWPVHDLTQSAPAPAAPTAP